MLASVTWCYFVKLSVSLWRILLLLCLSPEGKSIAAAILPYDAFLVIVMMLLELDAEQELAKKNRKTACFPARLRGYKEDRSAGGSSPANTPLFNVKPSPFLTR